MIDRFRAVRIASCSAALTYLGAAILGNGEARAQGAPTGTRWANFTTNGGYDCKPMQMDVVGQTSKLFEIPGGGYYRPGGPVGTVMVSYSADCTKQRQSPVTRSFDSYELPDGRSSPNFQLGSRETRFVHARSFASDPFFVGDRLTGGAG